MGVNIRVETNGSEGAKNVLTPDEIRRASGVIVAADKRWKWPVLTVNLYCKDR